MILNTAIFNQTVIAAKAKAAGNASILRAIDRAVVEIERAKYWSFADGVLTIISTTSGKRYVIGDDHTCEAQSKTCKHRIARLLMVRYYERLAAEPVKAAPVADERAKLIADVEKAWRKARPFASLSYAVRQVFGSTPLEALPVESLKQITVALSR